MIYVDHILHPNDILKESKKDLLQLYAESYGEEYSTSIESRMNHTLYLFDSNPIDTMNFIQEQQDHIDDFKLLNYYEKECLDYVKIKTKYDSQYQKKLYQVLSRYFNLPRKMKKELLDLDIDSYSLKNISILKNPNSNQETINKIKKRQEKYLSECRKHNLIALTNPTFIHLIEHEKSRLKKERDYKIIKHSIWGKRMIKRIKMFFPYLSIQDISIMLNHDFIATNNNLTSENCYANSIVYFPLIESLKHKNLDHLFLHENRHVIESERNHCGLHDYATGKYSMMNELHTEDNAIQDSQKSHNIELWSNDSLAKESINIYEEMLLYTDGFFDNYRELLNHLAITGDVNLLEKKFGKKELEEFEQFLYHINQILLDKNNYDKEFYTQEGKQLVKKLKQ